MACKQHGKHVLRALVAGLICAGAFGPHALQAAVSYDVPESVYVENFDSLPVAPSNGNIQTQAQWSDGWQNDVDPTQTPENDVSLSGWYLYHPIALPAATDGGVSNNSRMYSGTGTTTTGAFYSFGDALSGANPTERALGMLNSGSLTQNGQQAHIGFRLVNNTGVTLNSFTLTYDGEQYHRGPEQETLMFSYSTSATPSDWTTADFTRMPFLDFTGPNVGAAGRSLATTPGITRTVGLTWEPGAELWLRWSDLQLPAPTTDAGLAIDNLQFSASTAAGPSLVVNSIATGLASAPTTWSNNQAPLIAHSYHVNNGHTVTVDSALPAWTELRVLSGGVANVNAAGNGQAISSLVVEAGGNVTTTATGDVTIGNSVALNDGVSSATNLGTFQTAQDLTFNVDAGAKLGIAMRLGGTGNIDVNTSGVGSELILAGAADQTGSTVIRFNGTGDKVRLVKDQKINRIEMNSTGANAFVYETTAAVAGGVFTFNQNGSIDHDGKNRLIQPSVINVTNKTVTIDLSKKHPSDPESTVTPDERRFLLEFNLQGSGTLIVQGADEDPTNLGVGGTNGTTLNEFELGQQTAAGDVNNSFSGTLVANDYVNLELRKNLRAAKIVVNNHAVFDMGFPSVNVIVDRETMQFGDVEINDGGTLEVGFEASIAGGKIGRHVAHLDLVATHGRSGNLKLNNGATTVMQLNGLGSNDYDTINAQGNVTLDGTLKIVVNPSAFTGTNPLFNPNIGDFFPLITATGISPAADFNNNMVVDAADLAVWKGAFGQDAGADANGDGVTDGNDFLIWQRTLGTAAGISGEFDSIVVEDPDGWMAGKAFQVQQTPNSFGLLVVEAAFAAVPEPSALLLSGVALAGLALRRRR